MKKLFCLIFCTIMLFSNLFCVNAKEIDEPYIEKVLTVSGTTPKDAAVFDTLSVSSDDIDISNQIYTNIMLQDPDMFLLRDTGINKINPWKDMNNNELVWVRGQAAEIMADCDTADEKIYAAAEYVALKVCYDYDYFTHGTKKYEDLNHNAYDVLINETAVCYGYAAAASALLQCEGIPCILVHSPDHVWNMAYNGERWILFDPTWMSDNRFEYGIKEKSSYVDLQWFDYTIDTANSNYNHVLTDADYAEYDNGIYSFPVYSKITSYEIPTRITTVDEYAFYGCKGISLTYDGKFENLGRAAFYECSLFSGVINLSDIKSMAEFAFYGCSSITDVILGDGVTAIPYAAFYACTSLRNVVMSASIIHIEEFAFSHCNGLSTVYYYGSPRDWGDILVDDNNPSLNRVSVVYDYLPSIKVTMQGTAVYKINYIGVPFGEIVVLAEYKDGELINAICEPLQNALSFDVSDKHDEVKVFVFENASSLRPFLRSTLATGTLYFNNESNGELELEEAAITECIDKDGYIDYSKVTLKLVLNANDAVDDIVICLSSLVADELSESIYLNQIDMPQSGVVEVPVSKSKIAKALDIDEFCDCSLSLKISGTGIKIPISKTVLCKEYLNEEENGFRYNRLTGEIEIFADGDMADYTFSGGAPWYAHAANITSIRIYDGVTRIGNNAFVGCTSVTNVIFPRNLQSIGENAFNGAGNLAEVRIPSKGTLVEEGAFDGCSDSLVIYCPQGSKADEYARLHGITVEYIAEYIPCDANGDFEVNIRDVTLMLQHIAKWNVIIDKLSADANSDGTVNIRDVTLALQRIAGWDV